MKEKRWLGTQKYELHCFYCGGFHMTGNCPQIVKEMDNYGSTGSYVLELCHSIGVLRFTEFTDERGRAEE